MPVRTNEPDEIDHTDHPRLSLALPVSSLCILPFGMLTRGLAGRSLTEDSHRRWRENRMSRMLIPMLPPFGCSSAPGLTGARGTIASFLLGALLTVLHAIPVLAGNEFEPSSVEKGVLLVASPALDDPNFRQSVVLVVDHGPGGTLGIILNRPTSVLLSGALPDLTVLKGTTHRLFTGGPVMPTRFVLLLRVKEPPADARSVFDEVYVGVSPKVLERIITQAKPTETFRAFAGVAGWAPGQLTFEMLQGAWAILRPDAIDIFDQDPLTLWRDCLRLLQAPRVISN